MYTSFDRKVSGFDIAIQHFSYMLARPDVQYKYIQKENLKNFHTENVDTLL